MTLIILIMWYIININNILNNIYINNININNIKAFATMITLRLLMEKYTI